MKLNKLTLLSILFLFTLSPLFLGCVEKDVKKSPILENEKKDKEDENAQDKEDEENNGEENKEDKSLDSSKKARTKSSEGDGECPSLLSAKCDIEKLKNIYGLIENYVNKMNAEQETVYLEILIGNDDLDECWRAAVKARRYCLTAKNAKSGAKDEFDALKNQIKDLPTSEQAAKIEDYLNSNPDSPIKATIEEELKTLKDIIEVEIKQTEASTRGADTSVSPKKEQQGEGQKKDQKDKPKDQETAVKAESTDQILDSLNAAFAGALSFYINIGDIFGSKSEARPDALKPLYSSIDSVYANFSKIKLDDLRGMPQKDRIALFINLHNVMAVDLLTRKMGDNPHPAIESGIKDPKEVYERFFSGEFFTKAHFRFDNLKEVSLNDISRGILMGPPYEQSPEIAAYHRALLFDSEQGEKIRKEYLLLLSFGSPAGPMLYDFSQNIPIRGQDLEDEAFLKEAIGKYLNDPKRGVFLKRSGTLINPKDTNVPWLFKIYFAMDDQKPSKVQALAELKSFLMRYVANFKDKGISWNNDISLLRPSANSLLGGDE